MIKIQPTDKMIAKAKLLKEGDLIAVYRDGKSVRAETLHGENPYVWRNGDWQIMKQYC